jgi:hypothetical protein
MQIYMAVLGRVGGDVTYVALLGTLLVTPKRLAIYVPTAQSLITRVQKRKEENKKKKKKTMIMFKKARASTPLCLASHGGCFSFSIKCHSCSSLLDWLSVAVSGLQAPQRLGSCVSVTD